MLLPKKKQLQLNLENIFFKRTLLSVFILTCYLSFSQERITNFDVHIQIKKSGTIEVTENITIKAEGYIFERGLLRTLPLQRKDKNQRSIDVEYTIKSIKKDGVKENYFTKERNNEWNIYIGNKDIYLKEGFYKYQIIYTIPFQIGYYEKYDELYWNATGNGWEIPIENASCQLTLPSNKNAVFESYSCYTGDTGSTENNCSSNSSDDRKKITFTTNLLEEYQGLTIVCSFPKGIIAPQKLHQRASNYFNSPKFYSKTNFYIWTILYVLGMIFFYFIDWKKNGRSLKKVIIPEFRPPFDWSPAIIGYLYGKGETKKTYIASIVNIAVKGAFKIVSTVDKGFFRSKTNYTIEVKSNNIDALSTEEKAYFKRFSDKKSVAVNTKNNDIFNISKSSWKNAIQKQIDLKEHYTTNKEKKIIGLLLFILVSTYYIALTTPQLEIRYLKSPTIIYALFIYWYTKKTEYPILRLILFIIFLCIPSLIALFYSFSVLKYTIYTPFQILGGVFIAYLIYAFIIGKYTDKGTSIRLKIKGFKRYLEVAEKDRINILNSPELTPELFEELLPYAIALNVDVAWGKKFEKALTIEKHQSKWSTNNDDFLKNINHLSTSFNKSSKDTSSNFFSTGSSSSSSNWSSGSSSGGSSGGGGGGGGGGGW